MALRSIVDVDVNTQALDAYQQKIEKLQQSLKAMPSLSPTGRATGPGGQRGGITPEERAVPFAERLARAWGTMREHSREVVRNVREMSSRFLSITGWMSALTGLATLGGGLGFNALANSAGNLRQRALASGTTIGGLQSSQTELGRFGNVNAMLPKLKTAAQTPGSPEWTAMHMFGVTPQAGEDSADTLDRLLPAIRKRMLQTPEAARGMMFKSLGGESLMSQEDMRQLTGRPEGELEAQIARRREMRPRMEVTDPTARAYQDFTTKLREAGAIIETTLIRQLAALAGPLGQLSEQVTKLITQFVQWALSADNVKFLSDKIKEFAEYLGSDDFKTRVREFMDGVRDIASAIGEAVTTIRGWIKGGAGVDTASPPVPTEEQEGGTKPSIGGFGRQPGTLFQFRRFEGTDDKELENKPVDPLFRKKIPSALLHPSAYQPGMGMGDNIGIPIRAVMPLPVEIVGFRGVGEKEKKSADEDKPYSGMIQQATYRQGMGFNNDNLPADFLSRIERVESGGKLDAVSPKGAMGPMQFMPETWKRFGAGGNPFNEQDAVAAAARYLTYMMSIPEIGSDPAKLAAGYNAGEGRVAEAVRKFGQDWLSHLPDETQSYVPKVLGNQAPRQPFHPTPPQQTNVNIQNETGGNMSVTTRRIAV